MGEANPPPRLSSFLALIHPSDPWPLPGHPEAMKMGCRRVYFHTSAWKKISAKSDFRFTEFYEVDFGSGGVCARSPSYPGEDAQHKPQEASSVWLRSRRTKTW